MSSKRVLVEEIVDYLSFEPVHSSGHRLTNFSQREWEHAINWMRDSGIALYFLAKLKDTNSTSVVLPEALARLEANLRSNRQRVLLMRNAFALLNRSFEEAGVKYAAIKGFTLTPDFCPDPCLRSQSDLDYVVEESSLARAGAVVENAGYALEDEWGREIMYSPKCLRRARCADDQYEAEVRHTVELHSGIVDDEYDIELEERSFSTLELKKRQWNGTTFYVFREEEVFLLQVRHAFAHLLNYWPRLSWLLEIGYFLTHKVIDGAFWARLEREIGGNSALRDVIVVIAELSSKMFRAPLSATLCDWSRALRPGARLWIEKYARRWILTMATGTEPGLLPPSKLVLFLHQQFMRDGKSRERPGRVWLLHPQRLRRVVGSVRERPSSLLRPHFWQRALFHTNAGLRYLLEVPRWRYLNRRASRLNRKPRALLVG